MSNQQPDAKQKIILSNNSKAQPSNQIIQNPNKIHLDLVNSDGFFQNKLSAGVVKNTFILYQVIIFCVVIALCINISGNDRALQDFIEKSEKQEKVIANLVLENLDLQKENKQLSIQKRDMANTLNGIRDEISSFKIQMEDMRKISILLEAQMNRYEEQQKSFKDIEKNIMVQKFQLENQITEVKKDIENGNKMFDITNRFSEERQSKIEDNLYIIFVISGVILVILISACTCRDRNRQKSLR